MHVLFKFEGCDNRSPFLQLGLTALHIAAWKGHADLVEMLLYEGCSPTALSNSGKTALQLATEESQHACVTVLTAVTSKVGPLATQGRGGSRISMRGGS
jgi:hypothetical protein